MEKWLLRTREEYFLVTEDIIHPVEESTEPHPCVLSPSFNFRSYLTVPSETNRNPRDIRRDLFRKNLPEDIEQLKYQFIDLETTGNGDQTVLAIAITDERYREILGDDLLSEDVYFFESLICESSYTSKTLQRVYFPDGLFYGFFGEHLNWSRFITAPQGNQREMTETYVHENFEDYQEETIKQFNGDEESRQRWARRVREIIPTEFDSFRPITARIDGGILKQVKSSFLVLILLLILAASTWIVYEYKRQSQLSSWISTKYQKVIGSSTEDPLDSLQQKIDNLKGTAGENHPLYPILMTFDQSLSEYSVRVLRIQMNRDKATLVTLAKSLEEVESIRDDLQQEDKIRDVAITSSESKSFREFNYEVQLSITWSEN